MAGGKHLIVALGLFLVLGLASASAEIIYESEPFTINEWDQNELVRLANESGYAIRLEVEPLVCRDENWTLDESGNCAGGIPVSGAVYEYINCNNYTFSAAEKQININFIHTLGIRFQFDEFDVKFGYIVRIYPKQNFNLVSAKEMIKSELKTLGLVNDSFSLKLNEIEYTPAVTYGNSGTWLGDSNSVFLIIGIVIIAIVIAVVVFKKG